MSSISNRLQGIIKEVLADNNLRYDEQLVESTKLRSDLGFDSLQLAELTVRLEDEFDVDVFESGIVETVGEVQAKLAHSE